MCLPVSMTPPAPPSSGSCHSISQLRVPLTHGHLQAAKHAFRQGSGRSQSRPTPGDASCTCRQAALVCLSSAGREQLRAHRDMGTQCLRGNGPNLCSFKSLPSLWNVSAVVLGSAALCHTPYPSGLLPDPRTPGTLLQPRWPGTELCPHSNSYADPQCGCIWRWRDGLGEG